MGKVIIKKETKTFPISTSSESIPEFERVRPLILAQLKDTCNYTMTLLNMGSEEDNVPTIVIGVNDIKKVPEITVETNLPIYVREVTMWGSFEARGWNDRH